MAPDGSISDKHGWDDATTTRGTGLLGMDRFEAREAIVEWFRQEKLLEEVRDYAHEVGHSYRSHVPIEPYLSDQWYIAVKKPIEHLAAKFGSGLIAGTDVPVNSLAGLALKPLLDGRLQIHPRTLRQNLSDLAGKPPRLAHQPPTLVGPSDTGLDKRPATPSCRSGLSSDGKSCNRVAAKAMHGPSHSMPVSSRWSSQNSNRQTRSRRLGPRRRCPRHMVSVRPCGRSVRWAGRMRRRR